MKVLKYILPFLFWTVLCASCLWFYMDSQTEGVTEERIEEEYALKYIEYMRTSEPEASQEETESKIGETTETYDHSFDYADDAYYSRDGVTFTPDYAKGELFGVLEIPTIELRRGIYTGSWNDIAHDLDAWMVTTSRPDYEMGETHLCLYGHNTLSQAISFNNLKYVHIGDFFVITRIDRVYFYEVTRFFAEWRNEAEKKYVNNMSLDPSLCYILTCGRDEYRYRDIIVEGTLKRTFTIRDWETEETSEWLKNNYRTYKYAEKTVGVTQEKEQVHVFVEKRTDGLRCLVKDNNGLIVRTKVWMFDEDGNLVSEADEKDGAGWFPLSEGTYVIGVIDDNYESENLLITIDKESRLVVERIGEETLISGINPFIIYAAVAAMYIIGAVVILLLIRVTNRRNL